MNHRIDSCLDSSRLSSCLTLSPVISSPDFSPIAWVKFWSTFTNDWLFSHWLYKTFHTLSDCHFMLSHLIWYIFLSPLVVFGLHGIFAFFFLGLHASCNFWPIDLGWFMDEYSNFPSSQQLRVSHLMFVLAYPQGSKMKKDLKSDPRKLQCWIYCISQQARFDLMTF